MSLVTLVVTYVTSFLTYFCIVWHVLDSFYVILPALDLFFFVLRILDSFASFFIPCLSRFWCLMTIIVPLRMAYLPHFTMWYIISVATSINVFALQICHRCCLIE